ncbi:MAG: serine/threonine protein kinase, partial [Gammaproteobacteria bacterium]|nr:serine/threonine protein kinase [Gammaproteobacteria bacterium]
VMPFEHGRNLQSYIKSRGGRLSEELLRTVLTPLLDALRLIHSRDLLHLDIKPGNIHLRPGGSPLLLDFGALHRRFEHGRAYGGQVITAGFSPIEQYEPSGYVGPWTDIYALGATLRACIEGRPPLPAPQRYQKDTLRPAVTAFKKRYSQNLLRVIDWTMEVDPLLRPQRVDEVLTGLAPDAVTVPMPICAAPGRRMDGAPAGKG